MSARHVFRQPAAVLALVLAAMSLAVALLGWPVGRVTEIAIYTLYGLGVAVLVSYTGLVPFGAAVFFGVANYAAAIAGLRWWPSEALTVPFAVIVAALLAVLLGAIVLRRRGLYFSLLTLAGSQIAFEVALRWSPVTGGDNGLQNVPAPLLASPWSLHLAVCVLTVLCAWGLWTFVHSSFGRAMQAVRDNEARAASLGFSPWRYKYGAFVLSGAVVGLSGALYAYLIRGAYTNPLGWEHAGDALLMLLLGGMHHFLGPLWGAIAFVLLKDSFSSLVEHWWLLFAPAIILFTLVAPNGIHGLLRRHGELVWTLVRPRIPTRPGVIAPLQLDAGDTGDAPLLSVRGLCKRFGSVETARSIDFDVMPRKLHSVIGPNGAGKTTLFNMLTGQLRPDAGTITLSGRDITTLPPQDRARLGLGRSFQIVNAFPHLTPFENVRLAVQASAKVWGGHPLRDAYLDNAINGRTWSALDMVGLADKAAMHCSQLSHGERRLLEIAMTVATNARLLLLDEPLAGLTESDRVRVAALIRRLADTHAVLLVEHDIDRVLELSDRISVLHQGRLIADGTPSEVACHPEVISAYIGTARGAAHETTLAVSHAGPREVIRLSKVSAGYDGSRVLEDVDMVVHEREVVAVLGRNGVGKTTLLHTLMGTVPLLGGEITVQGQTTRGLPPHAVNRMGVAIVPEGRRLFGNLTVADNLRIAQRPGGASFAEVFALLPKLAQLQGRRAEHLSGGERQMVAIARALMAPAEVVLLDEPFEGLAPTVVQDLTQALHRLKGQRSMVLVEHDAETVLSLADRIYALVNGRVVFSGTTAEFMADSSLRESLLGLAPVAPGEQTAAV
ncbi:MAG: branched-chain amino acid ABC transporter ATP-binding protein/permease [Pseudomonadota bacterium]